VRRLIGQEESPRLEPGECQTYDVVEARKRLWEFALERASLNLLSMYFAHLILRQVDWSLRFRDQTTSDRYITRGYMLLEDIERRSHVAF